MNLRVCVLSIVALSFVACVPASEEPSETVPVITIDEPGQTTGSTEDEDEDETGETDCEPRVCAADACGVLDDGCGGSIECGPCIDEERLEALGEYVDAYVAEMIARSFPTDVTDYQAAELSAETRDILREHRASDAGFVAALRHALLESRIGHAAIYEGTSFTCTDIPGAGDGSVSMLGACAVPHPDGMLVSQVAEGNPLGLLPGDLVVSADGNEDDALVSWSLARPVCGGGAASDQARREEAARSFFSALPAETELVVQGPDGDTRTVTVPATQRDWLYCRDPLGRDTRIVAKSWVRDDGIAVIHLPAFTPPGGFDPNGDVMAQIQAFEDAIFAEFEKVRDADALIWDVRSNLGGASPVGFSIAAGNLCTAIAS